MIEIKKLAKYYGDLAAVDDLSLKIEEGDIFGFIGPNGAGKTTTMRVLVTLLEPTAGKAFINGLDVTKEGKKVRRLVGYMPDFMGVYDDLKVFEYPEFFAGAFGVERKRRKSIVEGVLEPMGVELSTELGDAYITIGGSFGNAGRTRVSCGCPCSTP